MPLSETELDERRRILNAGIPFPVQAQVAIDDSSKPFLLCPYFRKNGFFLRRETKWNVDGPHFDIDMPPELYRTLVTDSGGKSFFKELNYPQLGYVYEMWGRPACDFSHTRNITTLSFGLSATDRVVSFTFAGTTGPLAPGELCTRQFPSEYRFSVKFDLAATAFEEYHLDDLHHELLTWYDNAASSTTGNGLLSK